jgi:hypothetical protein
MNHGKTVFKIKRGVSSGLTSNNRSNTLIPYHGYFYESFSSTQKASPSLHALTVGVDFNKCEANIVGTGDDPFCLTRAEDVGRFVAAALDLDKSE